MCQRFCMLRNRISNDDKLQRKCGVVGVVVLLLLAVNVCGWGTAGCGAADVVVVCGWSGSCQSGR